MGWHFWDDEKVAQLTDLAATGMVVSELAKVFNASEAGIVILTTKRKIPVVRYSPAEQAEHDEYLREKSRLKKAARRARGRESRVFALNPRFKKSSAEYRRMLPPMPEMTKGEMRRMLHQAVLNTEGARV